jgi:hypothetical protein
MSWTIALSCLALAASGPACSSEADRPSLVNAGGLPNAGGRSGSLPGDAGRAEAAGESGENAGHSGESGASADGEGGSAGETPIELGGSGGKAPVVPPSCDQRSAWSGAAEVNGVSSAANETLLAITPDELDLAFLRDGALYVAHRAQPSAGFEKGSALLIPTGWSAAQGAALSADGKRLLLVSDPDRKQLGELTRLTREAAFSAIVDTSAFAAINQDSTFTGRVYASPTLSAGDDQLFFNSAFLDAGSTIMVSSRNGTNAWSTPRTLNAGTFDGGAGQRRLPTAISADGRTLFYFNEESGKQEARWRATNSVDSPLYDMRSLGARRGSAPNSACNRLYSEAEGDVVVETD